MSNSTLVLDCSVTMAWCFEDENDEYADAVLDALATGRGIVPGIWSLEVANVLAVAERRRRLKEAESARFIELLSDLPILVDEGGHDRAFTAVLSLARSFGLSSYDAAYLDLAMRIGENLATRDEALRAACGQVGVSLFTPT